MLFETSISDVSRRASNRIAKSSEMSTATSTGRRSKAERTAALVREMGCTWTCCRPTSSMNSRCSARFISCLNPRVMKDAPFSRLLSFRIKRTAAEETTLWNDRFKKSNPPRPLLFRIPRIIANIVRISERLLPTARSKSMRSTTLIPSAFSEFNERPHAEESGLRLGGVRGVAPRGEIAVIVSIAPTFSSSLLLLLLLLSSSSLQLLPLTDDEARLLTRLISFRSAFGLTRSPTKPVNISSI